MLLCVHEYTQAWEEGRTKTSPGQPGMAHTGDTQGQPCVSGPQTAGAWGLPLPEDHHSVENATRPPPVISLSALPPPPAPSCFDGRKKFQLFPSLFFQTVTRSGKEFPPPQTIIVPIYRCHGSRPILLCWESHSYFWVHYGGGIPGEGTWGCSAAFSQSTSPLPGSSPPPPHPLCPEFWEEGRKPAKPGYK